MKAVILAGGFGTRLSEETAVRPKPMVEIGGRPILWHIMRWYASYGIDDFIVCCGYKGEVIKRYFLDFQQWAQEVIVDLGSETVEVRGSTPERWRVTMVDTGQKTMTGGRLKRIADHVDHETFCVTYGDGLSNVDIGRLVDFHRDAGTVATLTAVQQPGRFGALVLHDGETSVGAFDEKPEPDARTERAWINGGFFVFEPKVFDHIEGDDTVLEKAPLEGLASERQLSAYRHEGFWQPMDTLRDKQVLDDLWQRGAAPWYVD